MADNSAEEVEEQETEDLDTTLANTLREIESRDEEPEEETGTEEEEVTEERERDEKGRFKSREDKEEFEQTEEQAEAGQEEEPEQEDRPEPEEKSEGLRRPPSSWSAKGKAEFGKLPSHVQDEILKRESDFHKGIEGYKERAEYADRISREIQPYEAMIRSKNSTPEQTVRNMLNTAYQLETGTPQQKAQLLLNVAQQFGADMNTISQALSGEGQEQRDPQMQQLQQQFQQLQQQLQSQQQAAQQHSHAEAQSSIEAFRNEVDEAGHPKHLYFDDVRDQMADLIESADRSGKKLTLQEAYDAAIWSRPDIREALLAQQQQSDQERKKADEAEKARQARKKARTNVQTSGSHSESEQRQVGSIDDTLRSTMKDIQERED